MKREKLKHRIENAIDAFFRKSGSEDAIEIRGSSHISDFPNVSSEKLTSKVFTILRQLFVFFPATFVLWVVTAEFTYMSLSGGSPFEPLPLLIFGVSFLLALMGLGDIRRGKDYVIPISIMSVGIFAASLAWLTGSNLLKLNHYGMLFFPLALIAPFVSKYWVDGIESD